MNQSRRLNQLAPISSANRVRRAIWQLAWTLLYRPTPIKAHRWRRLVLKMFGAQVAWPVYPYPNARIWAPWNLVMHRGSCLANEVDCYNVEKISLGEGVTVSQKSYLCTVSHDFDDPSFRLIGCPIVIDDHAWVAADTFVGPGVTIGARAVVLARSVVTRNVEPGLVVGGNPAKTLRSRAEFKLDNYKEYGRMSWQSNPITIKLRDMARIVGLTRLVGKILQGKSYEKAFDDALFASISLGDVIWDVGANVGYYTRKFAEAAGSEGKVFGFEPFPSTYKRLRVEVEGLDTVTLHPIALGAETSKMSMRCGSDAIGATSRIVDVGSGELDTEVEVATGDSLIERGLASQPSVIKIDTEGFELDVLEGMSSLLDSSALRFVFVEVHFGILTERGMSDAPTRIEKILASKGFKSRWVDPSHIAAFRG